ncbi:MAG: hypothetical protein K9M57_05370 [Phycisphaerae bacterium]|nr:hypothetical protein [Phycisphaerae bacterium]
MRTREPFYNFLRGVFPVTSLVYSDRTARCKPPGLSVKVSIVLGYCLSMHGQDGRPK